MKPRLWAAILIFLSAYSPLAIIFTIQDIDFQKSYIKHPALIIIIGLIAIISIFLVIFIIPKITSSSPCIKIKAISNRSGELINYSIPYMISFFVIDLNDTATFINFILFLCLMFLVTYKTNNLFINPILACIGYNLYNIKYEWNNNEYENVMLWKGNRPQIDDQCRIREISEGLYLITDINPDL